MGLRKTLKKAFNKVADKIEPLDKARDEVVRLARRARLNTEHARENLRVNLRKVMGPIGHGLESVARAGWRAHEAIGSKYIYDKLSKKKGWRVLVGTHNLAGIAFDKRYAKSVGATDSDRIKAGAILVGTAAVTVATFGAGAAAGSLVAPVVGQAVSLGTQVAVDVAPEKYKTQAAVAGAVVGLAASVVTGAVSGAGLGAVATGVLPQTTKEGALTLLNLGGQAALQVAPRLPLTPRDAEAARAIARMNSENGGMRSVIGDGAEAGAPTEALGAAGGARVAGARGDDTGREIPAGATWMGLGAANPPKIPPNRHVLGGPLSEPAATNRPAAPSSSSYGAGAFLAAAAAVFAFAFAG